VTLPERLALLIEHLPEDAAVTLTVSWLRSELEAEGVNGSTISDLTVEALAAELGRSTTSTVRGWLGAGAIPEAYKLGREWRIPRAAVRRFLDSLASNGNDRKEGNITPTYGARGHVRGSWRPHLRRTGT
jgi:excisionase family DNA binding protein